MWPKSIREKGIGDQWGLPTGEEEKESGAEAEESVKKGLKRGRKDAIGIYTRETKIWGTRKDHRLKGIVRGKWVSL